MVTPTCCKVADGAVRSEMELLFEIPIENKKNDDPLDLGTRKPRRHHSGNAQCNAALASPRIDHLERRQTLVLRLGLGQNGQKVATITSDVLFGNRCYNSQTYDVTDLLQNIASNINK